MKLRIVYLIALALLLIGLAACNLPESQGVQPGGGNPPGSSAPVVQVQAITDCRTGPGENYDLVVALNLDQEAEVVGRSADGGYWLVRDPSNPATLCWLSGNHVTVIGSADNLPVPTPPSTPTLVGGPGCPSPVPSGPTPVSCTAPVGSGCPSPVPSGPTPISCGAPAGSGCPTPIGGGPTPVSCPTQVPFVPPPVDTGPTPVDSGPTPVPGGPPPIPGCPSPVPNGPTPIRC